MLDDCFWPKEGVRRLQMKKGTVNTVPFFFELRQVKQRQQPEPDQYQQ